MTVTGQTSRFDWPYMFIPFIVVIFTFLTRSFSITFGQNIDMEGKDMKNEIYKFVLGSAFVNSKPLMRNRDELLGILWMRHSQ